MNDIQPGDVYEDFRFHPMLCVERNENKLYGLSLLNGSMNNQCMLINAEKISIETVVKIKAIGVDEYARNRMLNEGWLRPAKWAGKEKRV